MYKRSFNLKNYPHSAFNVGPFKQFIAERWALLSDRDCIHFVLITFISLR